MGKEQINNREKSRIKAQKQSKELGETSIQLKGIRVNNLKNIDLEIPRGQLVVITGVSGSGKSSLAFDSLYAEGQRRYVESLSSYARQFLGRQAKPECDYIKGLPPAVAIEQRVISRNPRSTVATSTEIYEYLRLLFARVGHLISPISGQRVKKHNEQDLLEWASSFPMGSRLYLITPLQIPKGRKIVEHLELQLQQGYSRLWFEDKVVMIEDYLKGKAKKSDELFLLIDRMKTSEEALERLMSSAELAFFEGHGYCQLIIDTPEGERKTKNFSNIFEADGRVFQELSPEMFSFNNPVGACPECEGFGMVMGIEEDLVIPNQNLSVYEDCVACWRGPKSSEFKEAFIRLSSAYDFPIHRPYNELSDEQKRLLWKGVPIENDRYIDTIGIDSYFQLLKKDMHKIQNRVRLAHFRGKTLCPSCEGGRLCPDALCVLVGGKNLSEIVRMTLDNAKNFFDTLDLSEEEALISKRLLHEIRSRLSFLQEVGLGYLTLDRLSNTLSGGESQRITLATQLGSSLVGSLYVLDEPSIGLHQRDTARLISVVKRLRDLGNTVIVVEHDEEMMRAADYIIDIGPDAGRFGGKVVYAGALSEINEKTAGHTAHYLTGQEQIPIPTIRRKSKNYIEVVSARKHNLKGLTARFPLNMLTVITGVSGSGKSTLVKEILYEGIRRKLNDEPLDNLPCKALKGSLGQIKQIEYVDQNNIGRNSRSNPCIYLGAYDEIRKLYSALPLAKQLGYQPYYFSFNKEGGRCEHCKGDGFTTVEMQFMADVTLTCDECEGKRFRSEILDVQFQGKSVYDILEMSVSEAIEFFSPFAKGDKTCRMIIEKLTPLLKVGLGYIKLGQSSSTLSGGENQRVKLAYYLSKGKKEPTLFIFDEPTTGLHFHDIKTLLGAINALIDQGHSVIIIEHNLEVIKSADWVLDLGPEGGSAGGQLVAEGTPEDIAEVEQSFTGLCLKPLIH